MLGSDDFDNLTAWFVDGGLFEKILGKWELDNSRAWRTGTTPQTRKKVAVDLRNDSDSAKKISTMILQIVTSCGEKYQIDEWQYIISYNRPLPEWNVNEDKWKVKSNEEKKIDAHLHFVSEVNDYLNLITVCGVGTREACDYIILCIWQQDNGDFRFNHTKWKAFVDKIKKEQDYNALKADLDNKQRQAELQKARESALSEKRQQLQQKLKEMENFTLEDLIAHCTDDLGSIEYFQDDDVYNIFNIMNEFKIKASKILESPPDIASNLSFLQLMSATYRKTIPVDQLRISQADEDPRVELARSIITLVHDALKKQKKQLEEQIDAQSHETAPAPQPAQPDATPTPATTWWDKLRFWEKKLSHDNYHSQCRVACLLQQLDECK